MESNEEFVSIQMTGLLSDASCEGLLPEAIANVKGMRKQQHSRILHLLAIGFFFGLGSVYGCLYDH